MAARGSGGVAGGGCACRCVTGLLLSPAEFLLWLVLFGLIAVLLEVDPGSGRGGRWTGGGWRLMEMRCAFRDAKES